MPIPVLHAADIRIVGYLFALDILGARVAVEILVGISCFEIVAITRQGLQNPSAIRPLLVVTDKTAPSACSGRLSRDLGDTGGAKWSGCKSKWLPVVVLLEEARWIGNVG